MGFDKAKAIRAAEKYLAQNKISSAVQEYLRVVEHDPEDITALNTLGDLYIRLDKKQEAVACFQRVAQHYRQQGFAPKAVAVYKKITRFAADSPEVALALAELYEQQGLLVDARAQYMLVVESHERAGRGQEALEVLRHLADLEPNSIPVRLRLADKYLAAGMNEQAAESFIEAGERQLGRGDYEAALEAFKKALAWRPHSYAALRGQLAAHVALGTADEAAEVLQRVVDERPGDLELRNMLARAQLDAENATGAEAAVRELVARDHSTYALFFEVARLHLQQGSVDDAVSVVARVVEPALSGRQEDALLEILQEALARDPDQLEALRALARVYTWLRDDDNLRVALENLAEIAETLGRDEEEREALTQLVRLAPYEWRYHERLQALGGAIPSEGDATPDDFNEEAEAGGEVPTFESFMLNESHAADTPTDATSSAASSSFGEFEWNSVAPPADTAPAADPNSSFADLNDGYADAHRGFDFSAAEQQSESGAEPRAHETQTTDSYAASMLAQELESVDFYLEQGYADIARDTLDMLERQYGPQPSIDERRRRVAAPEPTPAREVSSPQSVTPEPDSFAPNPWQELSANESQSPRAAHATGERQTPAPAGDPGLADFFDEFREDDAAAQDGDYETHYNMGLAYREMELLDQAVEEFQKAAALAPSGDGTPRYLNCCNMLGHCFMRKGVPRAAAIWFRKGLDSPGQTDDEYQALRFELATAYEQMGDLDSAINTFTEVYGRDVSYRGVADKLRELQARKTTASK